MDREATTFDETMQHPPRDRFLLFVDGEIEPKEAARWNDHLDACWSCRVRVGRIGETIAEIIDFEHTVAEYHGSQNARSWGGFDSRLRGVAAEPLSIKGGSFVDSLRKKIGKISTFHRGWAYAVPAAILIGVLLLQVVFVSPITAAQLLDNAISAHERRVSVVAEPVVYKRLKLAKKGRVESLEFWNDLQRKRTKNSSVNGSLAADLTAVLARTGFEFHRPLSASSYREWIERPEQKDQTVTDEVLPDGTSVYEIETVLPGASDASELVGASLTIRKDDWHVVGQRFLVRETDGVSEYAVTEEDFRVIPLNELRAGFFDSNSFAAATGPDGTRTAVSPSPAADPSASPDASPEKGAETITQTSASTDTEVGVLAALNDIGADMGDEISVKRENGRIVVNGLVDSTKRKSEILSALSSFSKDPSVKIRVVTVTEALSMRKDTGKNKAVTLEDLETRSLATASENELIRHFGSEAEARAFANRVVSRSGTAMSHVYALRRLARQFTPAQVKELSPSARAKWAAIIRSHASAFRAAGSDVSREVASVFGGGNSASAVSVEISDINELLRAVEELYASASAGDRAIRSALTISTGDRQVSSLRNSQFWQSARNADAAAARIAAFR